MYKKASRMKLGFPSKFGVLQVNQLWDVKITDLKKMVQDAHAEVVRLGKVDDDLAFLEGTAPTTAEAKAAEEVQLRFDILKDVWMTRAAESKDAADSAKKKAEIAHLEEILARKKEAELENLSAEELEKKIAELSGAK